MPTLETSDELQQQIDELQAKRDAATVRETAREITPMELPLASVLLKTDRATSVTVHNITPPELLFLVAEHQHNAKGNPAERVTPTGTMKTDARSEKARLTFKYGERKISALFPGAIPSFPTTFRQAMFTGIETRLPSSSLTGNGSEIANIDFAK